MRTHKVAVIGAEGTGPEVIGAGCRVLDVLAGEDGRFRFTYERFDWGSDYYRRHGRMMPEDGLARLEGFEAIYFGAVGDAKIPDDITLWGLRLAICQGFDQYANVRPTRLLPGVTGPLRPELGREIDWVIVRENSEGEYAGVGGRAHQGHPIEVATDVSMMTRTGVERIMRFAFRLARHPGGDQPARRHPQRPGRGAGRQPGHRADRQHRSRAALPEHVRAHPRIGLRHHGQGAGEPHRHVLV